MKKKFTFILLLAAVFFSAFVVLSKVKYSSTSPASTEAKSLENDIQITISDDTDDSQKYEIPYSEQSVLSMLQKLDNEKGLNLITEDSEFGTYIVSMTGCGGEDGKFWLYYVNGETAQVGAGEYIIKPGDQIEWRCEEPTM